MTKEQEILDFAEQQWGKKTRESLGLKLGEECGEVLGAIIKENEGRASIIDIEDEIGDVLIVLSQLAAVHGLTLNDLRASAFVRIKMKAQNK